MLQVVRSFLCSVLSIAVQKGQAAGPLYGQRQNYFKMLLRGVFGSLAMIGYYFALQMLSLGDAVGPEINPAKLRRQQCQPTTIVFVPILGW